MTNTILLQLLKEAVSKEEYRKLSDRTLSHICEFNRSTILEMLQLTSLKEEKVSAEKMKELADILKNYLQVYLPDQQDAWKWIILSCIYLCFLCHKPLHSQEMAHYTAAYEKDEKVYFCPLKSAEDHTACVFCVCRKMIAGNGAS